MMWLMFICFPLLLTDAAKYNQTDYTVKLDRVELVNYNRSYIENPICGLVYYNRTYRAANASGHLLKDLSMNIKVEVQLYKFLSNEYRFFPITMDINGCKELERDTFGIKQSFQKSLNFEFRCPIKRGLKRITYGVIDFSHFPPYIPGGQYKAEVKISDNANFLFQVDFYAKVDEILKAWEH